MFTGLISEVGKVKRRVSAGEIQRLTVAAAKTAARLKLGDSVAVAGACLTVEAVSSGLFTCAMIAETITGTRLGHLRAGDAVNLELPVGPDDLLGGHIVAGHIDTVGCVKQVQKTAGGGKIRITFPPSYDRWVIDKGSIAIEGISLTVADRRSGEVSIGIIPTTWKETTVGKVKPGDQVNIEFDQAIKAAAQSGAKHESSAGLTEEALRRAGW